MPDECQLPPIGDSPDCNSNGIPDGCDVDPTDPDGDGLVSPDDNGNGIPDECENETPVCDAGGPYVVECSGTTTFIALDGSGSSDPDPGDVLSFSWSTDCPGGGFDDNTLEMPTLTVGSPPPCPVTCNVSLLVDDEADTDGCSATVTIIDTTAPAVLCPEPVSIECDDSTDPNVNLMLGKATATDNCDGDPAIIFSDVNNLAGCDGTGTITRTWWATDACGNVSASCAQIIRVLDTTAPVLTVPASVMVCCVDSVDPSNTGSATATDNCDAAVAVTHSDSVPPSDLSAATCPQVITRTWRATDGCGNTTTDDQLIEQAPCCGNGIIEGVEECDGLDDTSCPEACLSDCTCGPFCGDGACDPGEDSCNCPDDCGTPPSNEVPGSTCDDGTDNDCDGLTDSADPDCTGAIPAVSEWGMVLLMLSLLVGFKLRFGRQPGPEPRNARAC